MASSKRKQGSTRSRKSEPLDVHLTVRFKFGQAPDDTLTMIDGRRVPMAGSLLDNRDRIIRSFTRLLIKAATLQPKLARELWPLLGRAHSSRRDST